MSHDVLIVGAGPTGMVLALALARLGVRPRIVDRAAGPGTTSRALAVQARTLELYRQLDLTEAVLAGGHRVDTVSLWVGGERQARVQLGEIGHGQTPYPFVHIFPQDRHERLLEARLAAAGVVVERDTELLGLTEEGDSVTARLRRADGTETTYTAAYLVGCDGAGSVVREAIGVGFDGGTYSQRFYVADIEGTGPVFDGGIHVDLNEADFLAVFGMGGRRARLVGIVRDERVDASPTLHFGDVSARAIDELKIQVTKVHWFSTYRVHHRVAGHFRRGRVFIAGDAGHIHSPVGGQGMNTGIGDAFNLAWKLAAVLNGQAGDTLLDSYESERIAFARTLVHTTDRVFTAVTSESRMANILRTRLTPVMLPAATKFSAVRAFMFRSVSQTMISYRGTPLCEGRAGEVHGGDRLPWVRASSTDNFDSLAEPVWQVHVYGAASDELAYWCRAHLIALHCFQWEAAHSEAGLMRDAAYLLRPDGHVAFADPSAAPGSLADYFCRHDVRPAGAAIGPC
jgi:2-polyprenyl-6-methoxyphenol hydroxylase-like FAD-dependent oxidoreductase